MKALIFDLDGTILDSVEDINSAINEVLTRHFLPLRTVEETNNDLGYGAFELIKSSVPINTTSKLLKVIYADYEKCYLEHLGRATKPFPQIIDILKELKNRGFKLGIVSNKIRSMVTQIDKKYFANIFDVAIGEIKGQPLKPDSYLIFLALEELDIKPSEAIYIGDTEVDIKTAQNAGIINIGVTWGFRKRTVLEKAQADYVIDDPSELIKTINLIQNKKV